MPRSFGTTIPPTQLNALVASHRREHEVSQHERKQNHDGHRSRTPRRDHNGHGHHAPPPPPTGIHRFTAPGWLRALWTTPLVGFAGLGLDCLIRWAAALGSVWYSVPLVTVATVTFPIGFLIGIGAFDYWAYYFSGGRRGPRTTRGTAPASWQDYFRPNTDHKVIGVQYLVTTMIFFVIGGFLAMLFRAELAQPGDQYFNPQTFNVLISEHAALMIFMVVVPVFAGLGNFVIPLMIGAADMAFPRLNALSFWLLPIGGVSCSLGMVTPGGGPSAGWTCYAPLCSHQPLGQVFFNMGVQWAGASSIVTALNFLVTIITMRAPGMTFWRMPLLVWANFSTSTLVVLATPFIAGSQFFVMFDRVMHMNFFETAEGGYVLGYQHIFWFYSHPAVYIMMLPGFGIISEVVSVMSRKPIFGYRLMALSPARDPGARLLGLGAPHVRRRHGLLAARADDGHDAPDRRPDRDQDLLLGRDDLGREDPLHDARCCGPSASSPCSRSAASRASTSARCRSTSTRATRTSSSPTSTTCSSAARCSRSSRGSTTGSRR